LFIQSGFRIGHLHRSPPASRTVPLLFEQPFTHNVGARAAENRCDDAVVLERFAHAVSSKEVSVLVGSNCSNQNGVTHFGTEHFCLPSKDVRIKISHAFSIFRWHFKVDYRVYLVAHGSLSINYFIYFYKRTRVSNC
jgi:hypothetical protein